MRRPVSDKKAPALILGAATRVYLAIARSLSQRGIRVFVANNNPTPSFFKSKYIDLMLMLPSYSESPGRFIGVLCDFIRDKTVDILIPASDSALNIIAENYKELGDVCKNGIACPRPEVLSKVLDKRLTLKLAKDAGLPTPLTYDITDASSFDKMIESVTFPVVCKPSNKKSIEEHTFKTQIFYSADSIRGALTTDPGLGVKSLFQEYCHGDGIGIEVLVHNGRPEAVFQHRRLKDFPAAGGVGALVVSEAVDPRLADYAITMLRKIEWEGVAMVEFRYEKSTKRAFLMEINGRFWGSLQLAILAGMDFPYYQWQVIHGEKPYVPSKYRTGIRARWTMGLLLRFRESLTDQRRLPDREKSFKSCLLCLIWDFLPNVKDMVFMISDPMPALVELFIGLKESLTNDVKSAVRSLVPIVLLRHRKIYLSLDQRYRDEYIKLRIMYLLGVKKKRPFWRNARGLNILFVCNGNIIRSPMAAGLLLKKVKEMKSEEVNILSAGYNAVAGKEADWRAVTTCMDYGISLREHSARPVSRELIDWANVIFVMSYYDEARFIGAFPDSIRKSFLLGAYYSRDHGSVVQIEDPFTGSPGDVRDTYVKIYVCIENLAMELDERRRA